MANQFKTFVAGDVLTAAEVNAYLMKQAVIVCDNSGSYPTSPVEGMTVWDKGADALKVYTTATTGWQAPWSLPWGYVASASTTPPTNTPMSNYTVVTTTLTGVTANRRYRIHGVVSSAGSPSVTDPELSTEILFAGSSITSAASKMKGSFSSPGWFVNHHMSGYASTGAGGSITVLIRLTFVGSNAFVSACNLLIEDVGPSAAPA